MGLEDVGICAWAAAIAIVLPLVLSYPDLTPCWLVGLLCAPSGVQAPPLLGLLPLLLLPLLPLLLLLLLLIRWSSCACRSVQPALGGCAVRLEAAVRGEARDVQGAERGASPRLLALKRRLGLEVPQHEAATSGSSR